MSGTTSLYNVWLNDSVLAVHQTGEHTYTLGEPVPMRDNTISMSFSAPQCDSNITDIYNNTGKSDQPFVIADYSALQCMSALVNNDDIAVSTYYRSGKYWQFGTFDAGSATMAPIGGTGTEFSGHISTQGGTTAIISNLNIGTSSAHTGLFGVVEPPFSLSDVHLTNYYVTSSAEKSNAGGIIGAIVKSADTSSATVSNCFVSGAIHGSGTEGTEEGELFTGGLVGMVGPETAGLTLSKVLLSGSVMGWEYVGGLIGRADAPVTIRSAQVHATIGASDSGAGGLVGRVGVEPSTPITLDIDQAVVTGKIHTTHDIAGGVVGIVGSQDQQAATLSLSHLIMAATITSVAATGIAIVNPLNSSQVHLSNVVNLASQFVESNNQYLTAALIYGSSPTTSSSVYRYRHLSNNSQSYVPFVDGKTAGDIYNGVGVDCSVFSLPGFWTYPQYMDLSDQKGWDFSKVAEGYLPTLDGVDNAIPFTCMNTYTTADSSSGSITSEFSGLTATLPVPDHPETVVQYFAASTKSPLVVKTSGSAPLYNVWLNNSLQEFRQNGENTYTLAEPVPMLDNTISMSFSSDQCDSTFGGIGQNTGKSDQPFVIDDYQSLECMQALIVNADDAVSDYYRSGKYWQFGTFDAKSATMSPIGTEDQPFSGHINAPAGTNATISNLNIAGTTDGVGLFGTTGSEFSWSNVHLEKFSVTGYNEEKDIDNVGSIIGETNGATTISNCRVSGSVSSLGQSIGGFIGNTGTTLGSIILNQVSFSGSITGAAMVGGLIGNSDVPTLITYAQVHAVISAELVAGGLIAAVQKTNNSATIDHAVVTGSINVSMAYAGGVMGFIDSPSLTASHVILAAEIVGKQRVAGLLFVEMGKPKVVMSNVVNLTPFVGDSASADETGALLGFSADSGTLDYTAQAVYRYQHMTGNTKTYLPFSDGQVVSGSDTFVNGIGVDCSKFSELDFWTNSASMGLSKENGWDFSKITEGYLPTLNGVESNVPFTCMNQITYPSGWSSVSAGASFGVEPILAVGGATGSIHYFSANTDTSSARYSFNVGQNAPFDVLYGSQVSLCGVANDQEWQLPAEGLLRDGAISLRANQCSGVEFKFNLSKSNNNLALSWTSKNAQTLSITFTTLTNLAGGTPPKMSLQQFSYQGTATSQTYDLGPPFAGTYQISVSGTILGDGASESEPVEGTLTWENSLTVATPASSILFADVFTGGSARTVTYVNGGKVTVSRVMAVNDSRYESIRWLVSVAVAAGSQSDSDGNTTYRAQDTVNRGAMAQFLHKLAGFSEAQIAEMYTGKTSKFTDIGSLLKSNPARYYAILWLADTEITVGCNAAGTKFCPSNVVNRGAMAEFMRKFAGVPATTASRSSFSDVSLQSVTLKYDQSSQTVSVPKVNSARMGAINWIYQQKITIGSGAVNGEVAFRAQDPVTRGSMAEFMRKLALQVGSTK
jgi:hypothetical protein